MTPPDVKSLRAKKCVPCEGGAAPLTPDQAAEYLRAIPDWSLQPSGNAIERRIVCKHFVEALDRLQRIGELAEQEQHHPDLHLTGYRKLRIEMTTHAIGGLSENDFIVAAKIDQILA